MKAIAKIDCRVNETYYSKGEEIPVSSTEQLTKLNEKGFIEPMSAKEIQDYFKEPKYTKKEEDTWH